MSVIPSRTLRITRTARGSLRTCSLNATIGPSPSSTRPLEERVVRGDQPALGETREHSLVVVDVAILVGIDEDEVELALEAVDRLQRRAEVELDAVAVRRAVEVALSHFSACVGSSSQVSMRPPSGSAPAIASAEWPLKVPISSTRCGRPEPDEQLEHAPGDRAGQHPGRGKLLRGLVGELREQRVGGRAQALDVLGDSRIDDVHGPATFACEAALRRAVSVAAMEAGNVDVVERFLAAFDRRWPGDEELAQLLAPDVRFVERPNLVNPKGGERDLAAMQAGIEAGRQLLAWQRYEVRDHVASGDLVVTRMRWSGELAVDAGPWPAGTTLSAWCVAHYRLADAKYRRDRAARLLRPGASPEPRS